MSLNLTFGTKVGPAECMVPKKKLIEKRFLIYEFYHPAAFARITCIRRGASAMSARLQGTQATSIYKQSHVHAGLRLTSQDRLERLAV